MNVAHRASFILHNICTREYLPAEADTIIRVLRSSACTRCALTSVEVKAQTLVAYICTPASITGTLHHKANISFVYKEQRTAVHLQMALQDNSHQLTACQI